MVQVKGSTEQVCSGDCCVTTPRDLNSAYNIANVVKSYCESGHRPDYLRASIAGVAVERPSFAEPHKKKGKSVTPPSSAGSVTGVPVQSERQLEVEPRLAAQVVVIHPGSSDCTG